MPPRKQKQAPVEGDSLINLPPHNPYYTGKKSEGALPLDRASIRSLHWTELNPAWLAQECINRGTQDLTDSYPLPGRVARMTRTEGGWVVRCYLGPPGKTIDRGVISTGGSLVDYTDCYVTEFEVEAGKMFEVAA